MKAGTYYIGDLCYCMHEEWGEVCSLIFNRQSGKEQWGEFTLEDGRYIAVLPTAHGDGAYRDQYGNQYCVDAGLIGCIRVEDIDPSEDSAYWGKLGAIHTFTEDFEVKDIRGILYFGHIQIDTSLGWDCD